MWGHEMNLLKAQEEATAVSQIVAAFNGEDEASIRAAISTGSNFNELLEIIVDTLCDTEDLIEAPM